MLLRDEALVTHSYPDLPFTDFLTFLAGRAASMSTSTSSMSLLAAEELELETSEDALEGAACLEDDATALAAMLLRGCSAVTFSASTHYRSSLWVIFVPVTESASQISVRGT